MFLTGCNVNVAGKQRPFLIHTPIRGELELVAESRTDEQGNGQTRTKNKTRVFEERLRLQTSGNIYHPNFLLYDVAVGVGLTQQKFSSDTESSNENGDFKEYDILLQLLSTKSYPLTVHIDKSEDLLPRQFVGSLRSKRESLGLSMPLRLKKWPMLFQYNTSSVEQKAVGSTANDFYTRDDKQFRYSVEHDFSERSHMRFEFSRDMTSQKNRNVSTNINTDRYTFFHDFVFGQKKQHRLNSFVSVFNQSGDFDYKNTRWHERLRLQHSLNFQTNYEFEFSESKQQSFKNTETRGKVGFQYKLYKSLITSGDIFVSESDLGSQGKLTQQGGSVNFSYQKKNRWGKLFSSYTINLIESEQSSSGGTGSVIDESHVFTDPLPITLNKVSIDTSTIVVTDSTGTNIYTLGDDYTITEISGQVKLNMTVFGVIVPNVTDGQTILVDYNYFMEPKRKDEILRQNFTIRQRFRNGLSLYYWHQRQDKKVSSTITDITPDEFRINTFGVDFTKKGLWLLAEYSKEDSTQISSTSKRFEARYNWFFNNRTRIGMYLTKNWLSFGKPDPRDIELLRVGGEIFRRLTKKYSISASIALRDEDDSSVGTTEGIQFDSELQYNFRRLSFRTGIEHSFLKRRGSELSNTLLYFRLKRTF